MTDTVQIHNQVLIMQALKVLLYPYASDYQWQRDVIANQLDRQIEFCCTRFHSMPDLARAPQVTGSITYKGSSGADVLGGDCKVITPGKGSSDPAGEDLIHQRCICSPIDGTHATSCPSYKE